MPHLAADFGFDDQQRDRMLGGVIAAAFYLVGQCSPAAMQSCFCAQAQEHRRSAHAFSLLWMYHLPACSSSKREHIATVAGAPAALLFGWLSDHVNRKRLLFAAVVLGEGPCMLTIFVTNYWQLFTLRLLTGIALGGETVSALRLLAGCCDRCCAGALLLHACGAEVACAAQVAASAYMLFSNTCGPLSCAALSTHAGALPVVFSLLGDLYDASSRAGISSVVQLSTGVGLALGQGIAGFVGAHA